MKTKAIAWAVLLLCATPLMGSQQAPASGKNLGSVTGGDFKALKVLETKCTACHTSSRINRALAAGKNMAEIQKAMEKRGVQLSSNERDVLGIYWKEHPLKEKGK